MAKLNNNERAINLLKDLLPLFKSGAIANDSKHYDVVRLRFEKRIEQVVNDAESAK